MEGDKEMSKKFYNVEQLFNYYIVSYRKENDNKKYYVTSVYRGNAKYSGDYLHAKGYKRIDTAAKVATELQRRATIEYRLERCRDCICLVAGDNGEWICDECGRCCSEVEDCPEGL